MPWGTLYIVATPLGHLGDLSARAGSTLTSVPVVAAEDTRRTRQLLSHLDAHPRLLSYHAHSEPGRLTAILEILQGGEDVALVSDAGTPGVSDPGAALVAAAHAAGAPVVPIPGGSAVTAAISASGLGGDRYLFLGFLPRKGAERRRLLEQAARSEWTVVLFEAPRRVVALLDDLAEVAGSGRKVVVARELTKLYEEVRSDTLEGHRGYWTGQEPRGEFTIVLAGSEPAADPAPEVDPTVAVRELLAQGLSPRAAAAEAARRLGLSRNEAYRLVMACK
ncbi:MAG: 16S rRNA (cytidine(1402)-2'-O)-methyltransferase [Gemmatimonadota bacterium]